MVRLLIVTSLLFACQQQSLPSKVEIVVEKQVEKVDSTLSLSNLYNYLKKGSHPKETLTQICGETNYLNSSLVKTHNNLGGFQTSKGYIKFKTWQQSADFFMNWQKDHKLTDSVDYWKWLENTNYHQVKKQGYTLFMKGVMKELERRGVL